MANAVTNGLSEVACATPHTGQLASQIADYGGGLGILDSGPMWPLGTFNLRGGLVARVHTS